MQGTGKTLGKEVLFLQEGICAIHPEYGGDLGQGTNLPFPQPLGVAVTRALLSAQAPLRYVVLPV